LHELTKKHVKERESNIEELEEQKKVIFDELQELKSN